MAQLIKLANGDTLKINGKDVFEAIHVSVVKQVNLERRTMTMIGTDESVDRDGDIVEMRGWLLENYRKNPVFLWAHNYGSVPLARAEKLIQRREPKRMEWELLYPTKGIHPFADMILELYAERIINASSVGFIPWEWEEIQIEDDKLIDPKVLETLRKEVEKGRRRPCGRKFIKQELLELSGCAVPANPNAVQNALKGKAFLNMPFDDVQKWLQGQALPPRPKMEDDVLAELVDKGCEIVDETEPPIVQVPENYHVEENKKEEFT